MENLEKIVKRSKTKRASRAALDNDFGSIEADIQELKPSKKIGLNEDKKGYVVAAQEYLSIMMAGLTVFHEHSSSYLVTKFIQLFR